MRQGIAEQKALLRQAKIALNQGEGDESALRALAMALADNLHIALDAIIDIDNAPNQRSYDMLHGGRQFSGVSHNTVDMAVTRVARTLRRLPALKKV